MKKKCLNGFIALCSAVITIIGCKHNNNNKELILTYLKIGNTAKTGNEIISSMDFGSTEENNLKIDYKISPSDASVKFYPELNNGFWKIKDGNNELRITINRKNEKKEYTAKIVKKSLQAVDTEIIATIFVSGGNLNGNPTSISDDQIYDILNGESVTVELAGPSAMILVASESQKWSSLKINGQDIKFKEDGFKSLASTYIDLPKQEEEIEIKIEASVGDKHTEAKFKIKRLKGLIDITDMNLLIAGKLVMEENNTLKLLTDGPKPSYKAPETAIIELFSRKDFIEAIEINSKKIEIKNKKIENEDIFFAEYELDGIAPGGKDVTLKVIPKDKENYLQHILTFHLEYKPSKSNAEFEFYRDSPNSPIIKDTIEWVNDIAREYPDDYGAKSVKITAHTAVAAAKVYYKFVYLELGEDAEGNTIIKTETELTPPVKMTYQYKSDTKQHQHISDKIQLFPNKPSRLKIYVEAEDGSTDDDRGVYYAYVYNNIHLRWDYTDHSLGKDFQNKAYDEIKLKKDSIKNKKIHLAFRIYNGENYSIDNSQITSNQTQFKKLNTDNVIYEWISTEVDVSELTDPSKEIEAVCPMLYKNKKAFTYKIKIKLE